MWHSVSPQAGPSLAQRQPTGPSAAGWRTTHEELRCGVVGGIHTMHALLHVCAMQECYTLPDEQWRTTHFAG